jgi:hypothetical protein
VAAVSKQLYKRIMAITKEKVIGFALLLLGILKPLATRVYKNWAEESPAVDNLLVKITLGFYKRRERARRKIMNDELKKKNNNELVDDRINSLIQTIGDIYHFNRVSVTDYVWLGPGKFPDNPVVEDFANFEITVTNEWVDENIRSIKNDWQHRSAAMFAKASAALHHEAKGYISIGPQDADDLKETQNLYGVIKSYRFKLDKLLFQGTLALSIIYDDDYPDLTPAQIIHIRMIARKIYLEKIKYIY